MSLVPSILFFNRPNNYGVEWSGGNIIFDLNLGESHNRDSAISDKNIEDGSIISDHIQNGLENGSLTGYVTSWDINRSDTDILTNKPQDFFDLLEELWKAKELVTILTAYKKYENVIITNWSLSKSNSYEDMSVTLNFRKVNVVKLQEITIELDIKPTKNNKQANKNVNIGRTTS